MQISLTWSSFCCTSVGLELHMFSFPTQWHQLWIKHTNRKNQHCCAFPTFYSNCCKSLILTEASCNSENLQTNQEWLTLNKEKRTKAETTTATPISTSTHTAICQYETSFQEIILRLLGHTMSQKADSHAAPRPRLLHLFCIAEYQDSVRLKVTQMRQFSVTEEQNANSQNNHSEQSQTSRQQWFRHRHFFLSDIVEEENLKQWAEGRLKMSIARSASVACHLTLLAFWGILLLVLLCDGKIKIWIFLYTCVKFEAALRRWADRVRDHSTPYVAVRKDVMWTHLWNLWRFWVILQEKWQQKKQNNYLNVVAN